MLTKAYIPYKGYYSTPFARWQGTMANEHAIKLAASTSQRWFAEKKWDPKMFDYLFLGMTIGQPQWFYGGPWASALIGADGIPGMLITQACSTSTTCLCQAGVGIETGLYENTYCLMTDRASNGPHTIWPNPKGPGGEVLSENWMMDNFGRDPWAKGAMIQTAENVSKEAGITREQCDAVALRRYEQYEDAKADDGAFQKRCMFAPEIRVTKKKSILLEADEGVMPTTADGLARLRPVIPECVHTLALKPHPANGHRGISVMTRDKAREFSADPDIEIRRSPTATPEPKKATWPWPSSPRPRWPLKKPAWPSATSKPSRPTTPSPPTTSTWPTRWAWTSTASTTTAPPSSSAIPRLPRPAVSSSRASRKSPWPAAATSSSAAAPLATPAPRSC